MNSDESPAVVELPDDVIKALVEAASGIDIMPELLARVPEAVEYVNAWRKTLIDNGSLREESPTNEFLGVVTIAATWAVNGVIAARVCAEAVAGERRRIAAEIRSAKDEQVRSFGSDPGAYFAGRVDGLEDAARIVAAGSVPVATPPRVEVASIPLDELPDWTELAEAAGATLQNHEIGCSGEYETVMHWPDGRRAGNRDRLAIISEDAEMEQFANAAVGPVATRLQPGRVGFGTDAFEVGGSLPGQPVATPTEPAHMHNWDGPCSACPSVTTTEPAREAFDRRAGEEAVGAELLGHRLTVGEAMSEAATDLAEALRRLGGSFTSGAGWLAAPPSLSNLTVAQMCDVLRLAIGGEMEADPQLCLSNLFLLSSNEIRRLRERAENAERGGADARAAVGRVQRLVRGRRPRRTLPLSDVVTALEGSALPWYERGDAAESRSVPTGQEASGG